MLNRASNYNIKDIKMSDKLKMEKGKLVEFMGKTLEESTKEELWKHLEDSQKNIRRLDKLLTSLQLEAIRREDIENG